MTNFHVSVASINQSKDSTALHVQVWASSVEITQWFNLHNNSFRKNSLGKVIQHPIPSNHKEEIYKEFLQLFNKKYPINKNNLMILKLGIKASSVISAMLILLKDLDTYVKYVMTMIYAENAF